MTPRKRRQLISYILESHPVDIFECKYCGLEFIGNDSEKGFPVCNQLECQLWLLEGNEFEGKEENL